MVLSFLSSGGTHAAAYSGLSRGGAFPSFQKVLTVGILAEYRYYVTENEDGERWLARARVYPNTETLHGAGTELDLPIADDVGDLQIALAYDSNVGGGYFACDADNDGPDDEIFASATGADDDWLFNDSQAPEGGEASDEPPWERPPGSGWETPTDCDSVIQPRFYYVRISTVTRVPNPDPHYVGETLERLEDRAYGTDSADYFNGSFGRLHRWRILQTLVDPRSLG